MELIDLAASTVCRNTTSLQHPWKGTTQEMCDKGAPKPKDVRKESWKGIATSVIFLVFFFETSSSSCY